MLVLVTIIRTMEAYHVHLIIMKQARVSVFIIIYHLHHEKITI